MYFDMKTKQFKEKNHSPNKIWGVFFDNKGRDYVMDKDVSYKEMEKMITKDSQEIYDFEDSDLYEKMKETGVDKFYTKKWFKTKIDFVKRATGYYKIKWFWTVIYTGEDLKWDTPSGVSFQIVTDKPSGYSASFGCLRPLPLPWRIKMSHFNSSMV